MAKLTTKQRNALPDSAFALPKQRKYPLDTPGRRQNAKARASGQFNKGNISKSTESKIFSAANRKKGNSMKKGSDPMAHPGHPMNLEMQHDEYSGGRPGYKHDTSSGIRGTHNMPAQHHDNAHPAGPGHPSIHSFHNIIHRGHKDKMSEG